MHGEILLQGSRREKGTLQRASGKGMSLEEKFQRALGGAKSLKIQSGKVDPSETSPGNVKVRFGVPALGKRSFNSGRPRKGSPESSQNLGNLLQEGGLSEQFQGELRKEKLQILPGKDIPREKQMRISLSRSGLQKKFSPEKRKALLFQL